MKSIDNLVKDIQQVNIEIENQLLELKKHTKTLDELTEIEKSSHNAQFDKILKLISAVNNNIYHYLQLERQ